MFKRLMSSVGTTGPKAQSHKLEEVGQYIVGLGVFLGFVDNNNNIEHHQPYPLRSPCHQHVSVNLNFENTKSVVYCNNACIHYCAFLSFVPNTVYSYNNVLLEDSML